MSTHLACPPSPSRRRRAAFASSPPWRRFALCSLLALDKKSVALPFDKNRVGTTVTSTTAGGGAHTHRTQHPLTQRSPPNLLELAICGQTCWPRRCHDSWPSLAPFTYAPVHPRTRAPVSCVALESGLILHPSRSLCTTSRSPRMVGRSYCVSSVPQCSQRTRRSPLREYAQKSAGKGGREGRREASCVHLVVCHSLLRIVLGSLFVVRCSLFAIRHSRWGLVVR